MSHKINILTRTSNRPNGFKRCADSIREQSYENINHIVSYDDIEDLKYLSQYSDIKSVEVDANAAIKEGQVLLQSPGRPRGKFAPYNLYMNSLLDVVSDGWIMILDDDDALAHKQVIENIVNHISDEDTILIWKMKYANGKKLPPPESYRQQIPAPGKIGSCCFLFHSKWKNHARWDSAKGSDFRFLNKIYKQIPKHKWINEVFIHISPNGEGWGRKIDL